MPKRVFNVSIIIGVLIAVFLTASVSVLILILAPEELWEWVAAATATLISAILAVTVGIVLFNLQSKDTDNRELERYRQLLQVELTEAMTALEDTPPVEAALDGSNEQVILTNIQPLILEDAGRSGLFAPEQTQNMLSLVRLMRIYNSQASNITAMLLGAEYINQPQALKEMFRHCETIRKDIVETAHQLHSSISAKNT
jgi:hypothetical protein